MHSLNTIVRINAEAAAKPRSESETSRHCSFHKSARGIVLHSAKRRSTAFIDKGTSRKFEVEIYSTNSQVKKDGIIESYFASAPTGKCRLRS